MILFTIHYYGEKKISLGSRLRLISWINQDVIKYIDCVFVMSDQPTLIVNFQKPTPQIKKLVVIILNRNINITFFKFQSKTVR